MPDYSYKSGKLNRSHLLHYLDTTFAAVASSPSWYLLGKDVEDASVELNPDTSTKKNILDETTVEDNGYEPEFDLDTFYAKPGDALYEKLKDIMMNRLTGDACKTSVLEVIVDKTTGAYDAWTEDVIVKPQSYGGPQGGRKYPVQLHLCRKQSERLCHFCGRRANVCKGYGRINYMTNI